MQKSATSKCEWLLPITLVKRIERKASKARISPEELVRQLLEEKANNSPFFLGTRLVTPQESGASESPIK